MFGEPAICRALCKLPLNFCPFWGHRAKCLGCRFPTHRFVGVGLKATSCRGGTRGRRGFQVMSSTFCSAQKPWILQCAQLYHTALLTKPIEAPNPHPHPEASSKFLIRFMSKARLMYFRGSFGVFSLKPSITFLGSAAALGLGPGPNSTRMRSSKTSNVYPRSAKKCQHDCTVSLGSTLLYH